jgi:hypothetical protein
LGEGIAAIQQANGQENYLFHDTYKIKKGIAF